MKPHSTILLGSLLFSSTTLAALCPPIHGCESQPTSTPITNFTFLSSPSTPSTPFTISWLAPRLSANCTTAKATSKINFDANSYIVPCSPPSNGITYDTLRMELGSGSAVVNFRTYAQCAADIYGITYQAGFPVACAGTEGEGEECEAIGEVVAECVGQEYLPPIRNPPPPPCTRCKREE